MDSQSRALRRQPAHNNLQSKPKRAHKAKFTEVGLTGEKPVGSSQNGPGRSIPARKPIPANVMMVPSYDNGTAATGQVVEKLRASKSNSLTASFQLGDQSNLYPAPLNLQRHPLGLAANPRIVQPGAQPVGIDKYRNRPLPPTPPQFEQQQVRNKNMRKSSHELLSAVPRPRVPSKAPYIPNPPVRQSATTARSGNRYSANMKAQYEANAAGVQAYTTQQVNLSRDRVLRAKNAVDSGKWSIYRTCPEVEALTKEERRFLNEYINKQKDKSVPAKKDKKRQQGGCAIQ